MPASDPFPRKAFERVLHEIFFDIRAEQREHLRAIKAISLGIDVQSFCFETEGQGNYDGPRTPRYLSKIVCNTVIGSAIENKCMLAVKRPELLIIEREREVNALNSRVWRNRVQMLCKLSGFSSSNIADAESMAHEVSGPDFVAVQNCHCECSSSDKQLCERGPERSCSQEQDSLLFEGGSQLPA